ncbi:MAG: hypothetical protein V4550_03315 [Gemmatimonadota bacterium]
MTYDESGELVHPDAFVFPHAWHGKRRWFAATPYPRGDPLYENPSLFVTGNGLEWAPPPGVTNPLATPTQGYLSDPDIIHDPVSDELFMYYRAYWAGDQIFLRRSSDGVNWKPPTLVLEGERNSLISPAVVRELDGSWRMWTVDAGTYGCRAQPTDIRLGQRRSRDGITWGDSREVNLSIAGWVPWHWDVQYISAKNEYWSLVTAYPEHHDCSRTSVFLATSVNGSDWTVFPSPLLGPDQVSAMRDMVYRSTFRYYPATDEVSVWFSGARLEDGSYHYALAMAHYGAAELLRGVSVAMAVPSATIADRRLRERSAADQAAIAAFVDHFP